MDKHLTREILAKMETCIHELNNALLLAQGRCSEGEFKALRRGAGSVLNEIHERMTDPLFSEHPDLLPSDIDHGFVPNKTLAQIAASYDER